MQEERKRRAPQKKDGGRKQACVTEKEIERWPSFLAKVKGKSKRE